MTILLTYIQISTGSTWMLKEERSPQESWVTVTCLPCPSALTFGRTAMLRYCQFISLPSTRVEVAFNDFINWDQVAFNWDSAGFWPWNFPICDFLFFLDNLCQADSKKNFICQEKIIPISFICQPPVISAGVAHCDSGYELRHWFYCHFLFFKLRAYLPPLFYAYVSQWALLHNCFNVECELFYPLRFYLSKR